MIMSGEQVSVDRAVKSTQEVTIEPNENASTSTNRVNINNLMSKVREEEKKTKKRKLNLFWFNWFSNYYYRNYSFFLVQLCKHF